jgi:hypothetical protein
MKTKSIAAIGIAASVFLVGCGGGDDSSPEATLPPPETIVPDQPATEGGELPEIGFTPPFQLLPLYGQVVEVKETTDNNFFFGIRRANESEFTRATNEFGEDENGITWVYSVDGNLSGNLGNTIVKPNMPTFEDIRKMPSYTPTVKVYGRTTTSEEFRNHCEPLMDGGEFCAPVVDSGFIGIEPHGTGTIQEWTPDAVKVNHVRYPLSQTINPEIIVALSTYATIFRDGNGGFILRAIDKPQDTNSRLVANIHSMDIENVTMTYLGADDKEISLMGIRQSDMKGYKVGDKVVFTGYANIWSDPVFNVSYMFKPQ